MADPQLIQIVIYFNLLILLVLLVFYVLSDLKDCNFAYNTALRKKRFDMLKKLGLKDLTISSPIVSRGLKLRAFE
jgi:hypothetical protein